MGGTAINAGGTGKVPELSGKGTMYFSDVTYGHRINRPILFIERVPMVPCDSGLSTNGLLQCFEPTRPGPESYCVWDGKTLFKSVVP